MKSLIYYFPEHKMDTRSLKYLNITNLMEKGILINYNINNSNIKCLKPKLLVTKLWRRLNLIFHQLSLNNTSSLHLYLKTSTNLNFRFNNKNNVVYWLCYSKLKMDHLIYVNLHYGKLLLMRDNLVLDHCLIIFYLY